MANLKPLGDRVLVQASKEAELRTSGIVIPDTAKEKPQEGKVIAVGPGRTTDDGKLVKMEVKVGDMVMYAKYAGTEVKLSGEDYLIIGERDILGVLEK